MKTRLNLICIAVTVMLSLSFSSKAQQYSFQNNTGCDVDVWYEMWDASCSVCQFGPLTITAGNLVNVNICSASFEICIVIMDVGGCSVPANHSALSVCHVMTPYTKRHDQRHML